VDSNRAATKTARKILLRITANLTNVFCSEKRATTDANVAFLFSALREGFRTCCYSSTPALKSATGNATRHNVARSAPIHREHLIQRYEHNYFHCWMVSTKRRGKRLTRYPPDQPRKQLDACEIKTVATTLLPFIASALFLQIATEFATIGSMFLPSSQSDRAQKISSRLCDGSIKAGHGTPSMTSSIARSLRV